MVANICIPALPPVLPRSSDTMRQIGLHMAATDSGPAETGRRETWWTRRESNPHFLVAGQMCSHYHYEPEFGCGPRNRTVLRQLMRLLTHQSSCPQRNCIALLAEAEGLEPSAVLPVALFESVQPAYSPRLRNYLAERDDARRSACTASYACSACSRVVGMPSMFCMDWMQRTSRSRRRTGLFKMALTLYLFMSLPKEVGAGDGI